MSNARQHFLREYESEDRMSRLLGDFWYAIEPFLLTPYRDSAYNTKEHKLYIKYSTHLSSLYCGANYKRVKKPISLFAWYIALHPKKRSTNSERMLWIRQYM